jgi:hypothetical protein
MIANRTREIRPSRMKRGACGTVSIMGDGLRSIGKPMERPPYPGMLRAPHFYPNNPTVRDRRGACGNVGKLGAGMRVRQ